VTVFECENCGAQSTSAEGVKEGDVCTKCPWYTRLKGRGVIKLVIYACLGVFGAVGWVLRKALGK
jgi:hypothetical protein